MFARARRTKTEEYLENEFYENESLFANLHPKNVEADDILDKISIKKAKRRKKKSR